VSGGLAHHLEAFFTVRLLEQKRASEHTIASYRDTFRLLLCFTQKRLGKAPSELEIENLDSRLVGDFLAHLEKDRGNAIGTRNVRLAAIHSLFRFLALREPAHSGLIQGVLAIPTKRKDRRPIEYLSQAEVEAVLAAPDTKTWLGRRDRALLHLARTRYKPLRHCWRGWWRGGWSVAHGSPDPRRDFGESLPLHRLRQDRGFGP
jgi:site-specific recombinase XerD